jgi:hypothetical protein
VHEQRVVVDRVPQLLLDGLAPRRLLGELRPVDLDAITTGLLRVNERVVCMTEKNATPMLAVICTR